MEKVKKILIADDEEFILAMLQELLASRKDVSVLATTDAEEALDIFLREQPSIVFLDYKMPKLTGIQLMEKMLEHRPDISVVIFTGAGSVNSAVEAMKKGAYDYVTKPMDMAKISLLIDRILQSQKIMEEKKLLEEKLDQLFGFKNFIGNSAKIKHVYEQIKYVAPSNSTVMISGESGTGKELVANALHYSSSRKGKPFVKVNCAALSENIIESELFGHEKGSFTSAVSRRIGRFELADNGTLFLDEIGDIPLSTQIKLLRVLEQKEFERVGGNETIKVDVRVIAATNRNMETLVEQGQFREDLFFRLNVINIHMAPLRERKGDIALLANHFLDKYSSQMNKRISRISKSALKLLDSYAWPGNVRELENAIERAVVYCKGSILTEEYLPSNIRIDDSENVVTINLPSYSLAEAEKRLITMVLTLSNGNMKYAAEMLGISRGTLYSKCERHQIEKK